ncbi:MAG: glycoside hydrolase family 16 protein [Trebonia sp.]
MDGLIIEDNRVGYTERRSAPRLRTKHARARAKRTLAAFAATVALAAAFTAGTVAKESVSSKSDAAVAAAATPKLTVPKGWELTFNQGFSGTKLNTKVWSTCYWWVKPGKGCTNNGNGNEEKEWYQPSQDQVSAGELHLVAKREATAGTNANGKPETFYCRSGMVTTNTSFNFEYGFAQFVVRLPYGNGLWPALWLAASNHKWPPEIDILEHWDSQTNAGVYLHPTDGIRQGGRVNLPSNFSKGWHSVTLDWTKTRITWYFDGHQVFTSTKDIPQQKMYLVMNVADTSTVAGACNATMLVKTVKVWQPKA